MVLEGGSSLDIAETDVNVGFGCLRGRTWVRNPSQAHSGTERHTGKPGFRFLKEQIQHQDCWARAERLELDGNGVWTESRLGIKEAQGCCCLLGQWVWDKHIVHLGFQSQTCKEQASTLPKSCSVSLMVWGHWVIETFGKETHDNGMENNSFLSNLSRKHSLLENVPFSVSRIEGFPPTHVWECQYLSPFLGLTGPGSIHCSVAAPAGKEKDSSISRVSDFTSWSATRICSTQGRSQQGRKMGWGNSQEDPQCPGRLAKVLMQEAAAPEDFCI